MCSEHPLFVGLMTGTSLDGIDAVLAHPGPPFRILAHHSATLPMALRASLQSLLLPGDNEIERAGPAHRWLGQCYANATRELLRQAGVRADRVTAIGCHGQTIRHRPGDGGFSLQLGCADTLASETGIAVVNDFRNKDMVLGGQGAPLAPRFHQSLLSQPDERRVILNLGGIANVTLLDGERLVGGFDTGPANTLLDQWYRQHQSGEFDTNGAWANSGRVLPELLERLLDDDYFHLPAPKSTGREYFNLPWLHTFLNGGETPRDVQATLAELTARAIAIALREFAPARVLVCGGGAHNQYLLARLADQVGKPVESTAPWGVPPEQVEAAAFAWLAWAYWHRVPGNAPAVTGACREAILGHLTLP